MLGMVWRHRIENLVIFKFLRANLRLGRYGGGSITEGDVIVPDIKQVSIKSWASRTMLESRNSLGGEKPKKESSLRIKEKKQKNKSGPEKVFLKDILKSCELSGDYTLALKAAEQRFTADSTKKSVLTTIIRTYGRAGELEKAVGMLARIRTELKMRPDIRHYGAAISACASGGHMSEAFQVLDIMKNDYMEPNAVIYTSLLSAFNRSYEALNRNQIMNLIDDVIFERNVPLDAKFYNAAIIAYQKAGNIKKAFEVFSRMEEDNIKQDEATFAAMLAVCAKSGSGELALDIVGKMNRAKYLKPNGKIYTSAMIAFVKCGQWEAALEMFNEMRTGWKTRAMAVDRGCYTAALSACAIGKQGLRALDLLSAMKDEGLSLEKNGLRFLVQAVTPELRTLHHEVVRTVYSDAVKAGVLPVRDEKKRMLNLIPVKGDVALCSAAIWFALQGIVDTDVKVEDMVVILGTDNSGSDDFKTSLSKSITDMEPKSVLKTRTVENNENAIVITKTSIVAWVRAFRSMFPSKEHPESQKDDTSTEPDISNTK
eukprot:gene12908-27229_t